MIVTILALALSMAGVNEAAFHAGNEELRGYLLEAGEKHPGLQARHHEWRAALERVPQATALDDPVFSYGQFLQSQALQAKLALAQKFPWFGTREKRGEKAAQEAEAALDRAYAERDRIFAEVKQRYFDYAFLGRQIEVTEAQTEVVDFMANVVEGKLALGLAKEDELLRIAIEQTQLQDRLDALQQRIPAFQARLATAIGQEGPQEWPWPQAAALPPPLPSHEVMAEQIRAANPDLRAFDHLVESRLIQEDLAKRSGYPDITLGIEYTFVDPPMMRPDRPYPSTLNSTARLFRSATGQIPFNAANTAIDLYSVRNRREPISYAEDEDNIMLGLRFNVPIYRKRIRAARAEARFMTRAAELDKLRKTLDLDAAAAWAVFEVEDAQRRHGLYRDSLVPQAQRSYEALQGSYAAGEWDTSFLDVIGSITTLLDFELEGLRAERDWQVAAARLEQLLGGAWEGEGGS